MPVADRSAALCFEAEVKNYSKKDKEALVKEDAP
jgi:predicted GIY-YIG superfamily endonuclease